MGSFVGGGRDNHIHDNYYEQCDIAQHLDNRGMNWDHAACQCTNGSGCAPAVAWELVNDPASAAFVAAYPQVKTAVLPAHGGVDICQPAFNRFENNVYCKCGRYLDENASVVEGWHSTVRNNTELSTCSHSPPHKTDGEEDEQLAAAAVKTTDDAALRRQPPHAPLRARPFLVM